jgi:hypothetical protein
MKIDELSLEMLRAMVAYEDRIEAEYQIRDARNMRGQSNGRDDNIRFHELEEDREYGPHYSPGLFGPYSEARRVRLLRRLKKLEEAELVDIFGSETGRVERAKVTESGRMALAGH